MVNRTLLGRKEMGRKNLGIKEKSYRIIKTTGEGKKKKIKEEKTPQILVGRGEVLKFKLSLLNMFGAQRVEIRGI